MILGSLFFIVLFIGGCTTIQNNSCDNNSGTNLEIKNQTTKEINCKTGTNFYIQKQFDSLIDLPEVTSIKISKDGLDGWISTHNYTDLGLKIYTDDIYGLAFKQEPPFIIKNGNMLVDPFHPGQYIKVIEKDPNESMQQIFNRDYISEFETGCKLIEINKDILTGNTNFIEAYTVASEGTCKAGGNGMHQNYVGFFYNTNKKDRYYLYDYTDGCAPGKCNVFNEIEFY